jgi:hypothetical protein
MSAGSHPPSFKAYGSKGVCVACGRKIGPTEPVWFRGNHPRGAYCFAPAYMPARPSESSGKHHP